jgi:hypothetical protein
VLALRDGAVVRDEAVRRLGLPPEPARKTGSAVTSVGKSRQARQPVWRKRVWRDCQTIAKQMNAALAGHSWSLTRGDVFILFRRLRQSADGDAAPLRAFLRQRHVGQPTVKREEPSEYLRRLPQPKKSPKWRAPILDAVPPPLPGVASPEPPWGYVKKKAPGGQSVRYASPGQLLLDRIDHVLLVLELQRQLGMLRAFEYCDLCEQVFVETDRRRDRGPQRVCSGCRPKAHRGAWKAQKRRQRNTPTR